MTIQAATPYLILNGKAAQAIEFYQQALKASTEAVMRFGDMDESCPEAQRNLVMHASLRVGKALLMLSDGGPNGGPAGPGGAVHVALDLDDADELRRVFDALSVGGKVVQPIIDAPWGAYFGAVDDRFGIAWMFNCAKK
jgi:PhnB protein